MLHLVELMWNEFKATLDWSLSSVLERSHGAVYIQFIEMERWEHIRMVH